MNSPIRIVLILATLLSAIGSMAMYMLYGYVELAAVGLSLVPVFLIAIVIQLLNDKDIFSPLHLVLYLLVLSVFLKTIYLSYIDTGFSKLISLDGRGLEILVGGAGLTILGVLMFSIGYGLVLLKSAPLNIRSFRYRLSKTRIKPYYNEQSYTLFLIVSSFIASVCIFYIAFRYDIFSEFSQGLVTAKRVDASTVGSAGKGSSLGYFRMGAVTLPQVLVLVTSGLILSANQRAALRVKVLLVILFIQSLIIPFLTSARLEMLYIFIMLAMVAHYYRKRMSLKHVLVIACGLILFAGVLGQARYSQRSGQSAQFSGSDVLSKTIGSAYFMDIAKTSVVVDAVPEEVDYLYGKSFVLFLIAPIPRSLWLEKPSVRISTFVGDEIYNRPDNSGIPPGFIAESYMNFGLVGVALCLLLLGVLCATVYRKYILKPRSLHDGFWYIFLIIVLTFTLLSGDLTVAVSQAGRYGVVLFIIHKYFGKPKARN